MLGMQQRSLVPGARSRGTAGSRRSCVSVRAANPAAGTKYDYIIVGGGSAGCVMANRLSADPSKRVLVLEAGGSGNAMDIAVPAGLTRLFKHPVLDWGLMTDTQQQLFAREVYLARGKTLGGSSCTNATLYHRGTAADYDGWNLDGWSSKEVLDWFIKTQDYPEGTNPKTHGKGGIMHVENPRYESKLHQLFFDAAAAAGIPANPDFNDWSRPQTGFGEFQVTQNRGERADLNRTSLKPIMNRANLKVVIDARATKVAFEKGSSGKRATGVEFSTQGPTGERLAAQLAPGGEVLLCSGAVHSPHLLMLSGIGSASVLSEHGVDVVSDLAGVGANLQDHPAVLIAKRMRPEYEDMPATAEVYNDKSDIRKRAILNYALFRRGPLTTTSCDHGAFVSTTGKGDPDLQMRFVPGFALEPDGVQALAKFGELKKQGLKWPGGISIQLLACRAKSRGSVGLKSADPFSTPKININYFSDAADLNTLREGIRMSRLITEQSPLKDYLVEDGYPVPGCNTDSELEEYIRRSVHSGNALVGTCRMGASARDGSVVSSNSMKVHGVEGLRVIDASVMPVMPGGQTGAAAVMIAERAATAILAGSDVSKARVAVGV